MDSMARRETRAASDGAAETKSARTRTRVLDAAAKVLSVKGYSGMRLADVAKEAELQAPAIYYYFDSREDLIEEVMWVGIANMREHLVKVLDGVPSDMDPLDRILVAVEEHLRHELEISDYTTASIRNAGQVPERIRKRQVAEEAKYGEVWGVIGADVRVEAIVDPGANPGADDGLHPDEIGRAHV